MEFTKEFIEENQLSEDQITAITGEVSKHVNTSLGEKVHEHTENSLSKIWETVEKTTGVQREQGERYADALQRASSLYLKGSEESYNRKLSELDEKIKNAKGDETLKLQLEEQKETIQNLKQKEAEYDEWAKNDYKGKYQSTIEKLTQMEQRIAFKDSLPTKPETVNKYEWDAKLKQFQSQALENNSLVLDENDTAWLVDKENEFKKVKLEDAVKQYSDIQDLLKGRDQRGTGIKDNEVSIEGVPFKIKEGATAKERQTAIKEYLSSQNITPTSDEYSKKFAELNAQILGLKKKSA